MSQQLIAGQTVKISADTLHLSSTNTIVQSELTDYNVTIGNLSGNAITTGNQDTVYGSQSGKALTTGSRHTIVGAFAGNLATTANDCTYVGSNAGTFSTASNNTAVGQAAGGALTTGGDNTHIGQKAGWVQTTQVAGVCIGKEAGQNIGSNSVAIGYRAGYTNVGLNNILIGYQAGGLTNAPSNQQNVIIGITGGDALTTGQRNTMVGNSTGITGPSTGSDCILINNAGVAGDDAFIRIGTNNTQTKCFVAGIKGVTTDVAAVACLVSSTGQLGVTSSFSGTKKDFTVVDDAHKEVKHLLHSIPNRFFKYKNGYQGWNFGPNIEDLEAIEQQQPFFPDLVAKNEDGSSYAVAPQYLPWLIIHDMQRMQREIDALRNVASEFAPNYNII